MNTKNIAHKFVVQFEILKLKLPRKKQLFVGVAGTVLVCAILICIWQLFDWSHALSQSEVDILSRFVSRTNSAIVKKTYDNVSSGGEITEQGAQKIIETAKEQTPGYGLASEN